MKQKGLLGCLVSCFFLLLGCNGTSVRDGRMPAALLEQSPQFSGFYEGKFAGQEGRMRISLHDDRPLLHWWSVNGNDLLDARCSSQVGALTEVRWRETDRGRKVRAMVFAFDPGACASVQGRRVELTFHGENRFNIYLLDRRQDEQSCARRLDEEGRVVEDCRLEPVEHYFSGTFRRRVPL